MKNEIITIRAYLVVEFFQLILCRVIVCIIFVSYQSLFRNLVRINKSTNHMNMACRVNMFCIKGILILSLKIWIFNGKHIHVLTEFKSIFLKLHNCKIITTIYMVNAAHAAFEIILSRWQYASLFSTNVLKIFCPFWL